MKQKKMIDFKKARQSLTTQGRVQAQLEQHPFMDFSPVYSVTNENIRFLTRLSGKENPYVLTAACSGDPALFFKLSGASHVDTFDISYCAKVISDIKATAIPYLEYDEYIGLLHDLFRMRKKSDSSALQLIEPLLPAPTLDFLDQLQGYNLFNKGVSPNYFQKTFITEQEFNSLKYKNLKPFNFIWSDIVNLHQHLDARYDVINFSNIFEYFNDDKAITTVLENVRPFLAHDGIILVDNKWFFRDSEYKKYLKVQKSIASWAQLSGAKCKTDMAIVLQKTK